MVNSPSGPRYSTGSLNVTDSVVGDVALCDTEVTVGRIGSVGGASVSTSICLSALPARSSWVPVVSSHWSDTAVISTG